MATSPNFNWPEPDNTDLVKNGALAIRTAVNAIDSSLVDLKGGTTGQILAKASNSDMDFVWAADAGAPTSLGYAAGKNKIINGDFSINQRNFTSQTTLGYGNFDRWLLAPGANGTSTVTPQTFTPGTAPVAGYESKNFVQIAVASQTLSSALTIYGQRIEDVRTLANQTVSVSFWAKANTGTPKIAVEFEQNFGTGGSPSSAVTTYITNNTISTSWTRYTFTGTVPSISGKTIGTNNDSFLALNIWVSGGSDFNARTGSIGIQNNTFQIWGVQVESGSTVTAFQTASGTIAGEIALAQRYYVRFGGSEVYEVVSELGIATSTTQAYVEVSLPKMRARPTSVDYSTLEGVIPATATFTISALTLAGSESGSSKVMIVLTTTGLTQYRPLMVRTLNSLNGYLAFSAEL